MAQIIMQQPPFSEADLADFKKFIAGPGYMALQAAFADAIDGYKTQIMQSIKDVAGVFPQQQAIGAMRALENFQLSWVEAVIEKQNAYQASQHVQANIQPLLS